MGDYNEPYDVGYGKPPLSSRFKKGQSGNPRGRPKGRKNPSAIVNETLYRVVTVNENGKLVKKPMLEVLLMRLAQEASKDPVRGVPRLLAALKVISPDAFVDQYQNDGDIPKHGVLVVPGTMSIEEWTKKAETAVRPDVNDST